MLTLDVSVYAHFSVPPKYLCLKVDSWRRAHRGIQKTFTEKLFFTRSRFISQEFVGKAYFYLLLLDR